MNDKLLLTPLRDAINSLDEVLAEGKNDFIRDASIHRFEYTFELCWKMIKRHLDWAGHSDTAAMPRKDLFRDAAQIGLISNPDNWFAYNQARNESSHTYNQAVAEEVYLVACKFLPDARELLTALIRYHG